MTNTLIGTISNTEQLSGTIHGPGQLKGSLSSVEQLNGNIFVTGGNVVSITVDSELSDTSTNPVQNKVVTKKITEITTTVGNVDALLQTI